MVRTPNSACVDPRPPENPGLDFYRLKQEGTDWLRQLSGKLWTDFNEHDPGVTTLEQLCYALTELAYRASLPVSDLLTLKDGSIDASRQALYPAPTIFTCQPVTLADYRKLIVDRVDAVANAWIEPIHCHPKDLHGLYRIAAYVPDLHLRRDRHQACAVEREIEDVYVAHRQLCEDLGEVKLLVPLAVEVQGELVVNDSCDPEQILSEAFFQLGNTLAPEPRRDALDELLARGMTPEELLQGPLLHHGWIGDLELEPKATCVSARELARVLREIQGVLGVKGVKVGKPGSSPTAKLDVQDFEIPELRIHARSSADDSCPRRFAALEPKPRFTLQMRRRGQNLCLDAQRVERLLRRRWATHRRTYPLSQQCETFFSIPSGQYRDLASYVSIQNQFPATYGIGELAVAGSAAEFRKAQALQLKGYLLVFEQLLANFLAQLAHVKDLFSVAPEVQQTYFFQSLAPIVPNVDPLLRPRTKKSQGYEEGIKQVVASQDASVERRGRFLDLILALYGEHLPIADLWHGRVDEEGVPCDARTGPDDSIRLTAQIQLLQHLIQTTADRGGAMNPYAPLNVDNQAGMLTRLRIQLGFPLPPSPPLVEVLDNFGVRLAKSRLRATLGSPLGRRASVVETEFEPPAVEESRLSSKEPEHLELGPPLAGQSLHAELVESAAVEGNFRVGTFDGETQHAVVCRCSVASDGDWCLLEHREGIEAAWEAVQNWQKTMAYLLMAQKQIYVVEHLLMRWAVPSYRCPLDDSFRLTMVISAPPSLLSNRDWQAFVRRVVQQNLPAHLVASVIFLESYAMPRFERLYWAWREALRRGDPETRTTASAALRTWLERQRTRDDGELR